MIDIIAVYSDPLWLSNRRSHIGDLTVSGYTQEKRANGGAYSATFSSPATRSDTETWLSDGLGRHIEVYTSEGGLIWEGFVDTVSATVGNISVTVGALTDMANRVTTKYTDFLVGQPARTLAINDTDSQAKYGIIHKVISVGSVSAATANNIGLTYLGENRWPKTSSDIATGQSSLSLNIECRGYVAFLDLYPYNEPTDTTYTAREKVVEVLNDCPNTSIFSTNYDRIESNGLSVFRLDNDDRIAVEVIQDIVNMGGDSNNNRRIFGVDNGRRLYLKEIPSVVEYTFTVGEDFLREANSQAVVHPYELPAGVRIEILNLGINASPIALQRSLKYIFADSVSYTYPYTFSVSNGATGTLGQQLAKLGLGSV